MRAYNPLSVDELGRNAARALMDYDIAELPPQPQFSGAGVYTIHYSGSFPAYVDLDSPIYVGKADRGLHTRLSEHAASIDAATNLSCGDFGCRWLVLEQVWIGLTEQILIDRYDPIWNRVVKGFGNHHQGKARRDQQRSQWDTIHPGRAWAAMMQERSESTDHLLDRIAKHRGMNHEQKTTESKTLRAQ